jgi:acetyl-CoA C-acetyltransferase
MSHPQLRRVAIVGGVRIPFVKSFGKYQSTNQEMQTEVLNLISTKFQLKKVDEVVMGTITKAGTDWNLAREAVLGSQLDNQTPAFDLQRACGTGLSALVMVANKIALGQIECGIAGGSDTNTKVSLEFGRQASDKFIGLSRSRSTGEMIKKAIRFRPKDFKPKVPGITEPRTGLSMGEHCELMAKEWNITREEQDQLAYQSHQNGAKAYANGFYQDMVQAFAGVDKDDILRPDTSIEKLSKLRPAFDKKDGTLTAGNSSAMTDGASSLLLASEDYAKKHGLPIMAYFVDAQTSAIDFVNGFGLLMAPTLAVSQLLQRQQLSLQDFSFYEIHEAFAAQVLCTLRAWEDPTFCQKTLGRDKAMGSIDRQKLNTMGSSLALGHPFAATGARIATTLAKLLSQSEKGERGLISICTGGGMGVAAILEAP